MKGRIFALVLAVGIGVAIGVGIGIGFGAINASRLASDDSSIENVSTRIAESLGEPLTRGESSKLDPEQLAQVLESLIQVLDNEISERRLLAEQIDELRIEMTELQQNLRARVEAAFSVETGSTALQQSSAQVDQSIEARLVSSGFTRKEIEALRRREAGAQMQQIELDDQARREGWINSPRYYEESNNLTSGADSIRSELGDNAYDRYLFASGRPNRIAVGTVIATSPAEQAGFKAGDVITSYGGERVFSSQQLTNLRSSGDKDSSVVVEIIRDGEVMRISMPRGPMGVQTQPTLVDPNRLGGK